MSWLDLIETFQICVKVCIYIYTRLCRSNEPESPLKKKQMELPALTQKSSAVSFFHPDVRNA